MNTEPLELPMVIEAGNPASNLVSSLRDSVQSLKVEAAKALAVAKAVDDLGWDWDILFDCVENLCDLAGVWWSLDESMMKIARVDPDCGWDRVVPARRRRIWLAHGDARWAVGSLQAAIRRLHVREKSELAAAGAVVALVPENTEPKIFNL